MHNDYNLLTFNHNTLNKYYGNRPYKFILNNISNINYINFFITTVADIPTIFKKAGSYKRVSYNQPTLKLINNLTKSGKMYKSLKYFNTSALLSMFSEEDDMIDIPSNISFTYDASFYIYILNRYTNNCKVDSVDIGVNYSNYLNVFIDLLKQFKPIFSFKVAKVDKNVRKYSRGKSGKYSLTWHYLPPYKRINCVIKWLKQGCMFTYDKSHIQRLLINMQQLSTNPSNLLIYRLQAYVHTYIFKTYKKKLANIYNNIS